MTKLTKITRLERTLDKFFQKSSKNIKACVVVNARGLLIADKANGDFPISSLAAMIALVSDVDIRVTSNLNLGESRLVSFSSSNGFFYVKNFYIENYQFRIGTLTTKLRRRDFLKRLITPLRSIERDLEKMGNEVKEIIQHG